MSYFRFPCSLGDSDMLDYHKDDHDALTERFRKTLYYGKMPNTERPSLPLTDIAVELFQERAPRKLGKIDQYMVAAASRENCISPCTMMMGMIYSNRLRTKNPEYLQQISSSDLFLISMMMASKFMYDEGVDEEVFNDEWADSVDMETEEINQMERDFLSAIDWNLFVSDKEFSKVLHNIETRIALQNGLNRGWFTYTDLMVLSHNAKVLAISQEISKVILVSSLTYLTGILTMIGSTVLVTAASATLGPIILQSQGRLAPLPITGVLPVRDDITDENVTQEEHLPVDQKPSLTKESIDYMLAELMTVVSLPTTFVKFWYSAMDQIKSGTVSSSAKEKQKQNFICSNGPCLPSARPNCKNVTDDSQEWDVWDLCSECQSCQKNSRQKLQHGKQTQGAMNDQMLGLRMCKSQKFDCAVKCCCEQGSSWTLTDTLSSTMFPDVPGFNTGLHFPIYVTT
ncbi:protein CNPPD1-like [Mytilus californianus]|uniref:protein CNPPD1-like n=1 Tax=Mytilus californianus TaxID=6549 RepID=UPI0022484F6D|nr:protein CNPPD1-like [Mytilus californianus]